MKILGMKLKSKNNSNIFIVETDSDSYILHSDIIVKYCIAVGVVDEEIFNSAVAESEQLIALNVAMKYVSSKIKTEKQIKDYLYKKELKKPVVEHVVNKLKEYKFIDDKTYADMYIRSNPNFSKRKVEQKLNSFGVKKEISTELVENIDDFDSCLINAKKFFRGKVMDKKTHEKLIRRLVYLGYSWDTIKSVQNELKLNFEE